MPLSVSNGSRGYFRLGYHLILTILQPMSDFCHNVDPLLFQHQVVGVVKEMKFRLTELIDASREEIERTRRSIEHGESYDETKVHVLPYRFSSVLALLQTFRDTLIGALGKGFDFALLDADVPHADLFRKLRNALVHDGYRPVGLWSDGRYFLPVNVLRKDQRGQPVIIESPAEDVETLCLQFAQEYSLRVASMIEKLPPNEKLHGAQLSYDWFQAARLHPSVAHVRTLTELPSREDWPQPAADDPTPLDVATSLLRETSIQCAARLSELKLLPTFPFP